MGGGDLNSKKSWHPNTMKNQERVWKAEQAIAVEKKRIVELQYERESERDRAELNNMIKNNAGTTDDNRLHWMYDKPDKKIQEEDFLLGTAIDKSIQQSDKPELDPILAVGRRVVGSSMLTSGGDSQVDMARKVREDPLLLIKERERAARAALLNNPLQRKRLTELLRKEQLEKKESKNKNKDKKKDKDLDNMLAAKLNALGNNKGIDLTSLLNSDDSSSDSSTDEKSKKKKKKHKKDKNKKKSKKAEKKKKRDSSTDSDVIENKRTKKDYKAKKKTSEESYDMELETRKRKHETYQENKTKRGTRDKSSDRQTDQRRESKSDLGRTRETRDHSYGYHKKIKVQSREKTEREKRESLTDEERARRLAAMAIAGAEREVERGRRVADQRVADEEAESRPRKYLKYNAASTLPDSVESRIHSNRHYIQRNSKHMNEHFARR